jgi:NAD(P)-dependent dehydrogenase (short-subunit alcohol dehydrogenase family)/acyl carrier protein
MTAVRPDVRYHVYDLAEEMRRTPDLTDQMFQKLVSRFRSGELRPLPVTEFDLSDVSSAFRHMAQGKHVGKVVVTQAPKDEPLFRGDRTYLITGGLGALGLQVAEWMAEHGAGTLLLVGRNVPKDAVLDKLEQLSETSTVEVAQIDVADPDQVEELFRERLPSLPPLAGVVHAAGVLRDGLLTQLTDISFAQVMRPKALGAWNLHQSTKNLDLDFFVLFSSIASSFGSPGQTNYAAANGYLDGLASYRRSLGLPAATINWGPWAESGMASQLNEARQSLMRARGLDPLTAERGLELFEAVLRSKRTQIVAANVEWRKFLDQIPRESRPKLFEAFETGQESSASQDEKARQIQSLLASLAAMPPKQRRFAVEDRLTQEMRRVLGLSKSDPVDVTRGFNSLGLDSLMAVELRSRLQDAFGISLPATVAFEYPNIEALSEFILGEIQAPELEPKAAAEPQAAPEAPEEPSDTETRTEEELADLLAARLEKMRSSGGLL